MSTLKFLLDSQKDFQETMGYNFDKMTVKERSDYMKEHSYFIIEEVTEMLRELPYHKSWKDYSDLNSDDLIRSDQRAKEEAIDILHFMINIFLSLGMDEEEIINMYKEKNKINYDRQNDSDLGYINK